MAATRIVGSSDVGAYSVGCLSLTREAQVTQGSTIHKTSHLAQFHIQWKTRVTARPTNTAPLHSAMFNRCGVQIPRATGRMHVSNVTTTTEIGSRSHRREIPCVYSHCRRVGAHCCSCNMCQEAIRSFTRSLPNVDLSFSTEGPWLEWNIVTGVSSCSADRHRNKPISLDDILITMSLPNPTGSTASKRSG